MRRRRKVSAQEPSLVPLADMLANTVGIMLFILAFTLLTTGGASIQKRLPMEQDTDAKPIYFLCLADRIVPVDFSVTERLPKSPPGQMDLNDARAFINRGDGAEIENDYFKVRQSVRIIYENGRADHITANAEYFPKANAGFPKSQLLQSSNQFTEVLKFNDPSQRFLYFFVPPEGMSLFFKMRETGAKLGFRSGWGPMASKGHVIVGIIGKGGNVPKPE